MKKLIFFWLFPVLASAQQNLVIENRWKACNTLIYVNCWEGGQERQIASGTLYGKYSAITLPDTLKSGLLKVSFEGNCPLSSCELIWSGKKINLIMNGDSAYPPLLGSDPETRYYWEANHLIDSVQKKLTDLRKLLVTFENDSDFSVILKERYFRSLEDYKNLFLYIRSGNDFQVAKILLSSREYLVPDWRLPENEQKKLIIAGYLKKTDLNDPVLRRSSFFKDEIIGYLQLVSGLEGSKDSLLITGIDQMVAATAPSDTLLREIAGIVRPWLLAMGYDAAAEYLDVTYLSTQCSAEKDVSLQERLEAYKRTAKGQPAPQIVWITGQMEMMSLEKIPGKVIITFWASWCSHCEEVLPLMVSFAKMKNIPVIAISLDKEQPAWEKATALYPGWIHLRVNEGWKDPWVTLYGITGTPTFFLLDENKNILGKASTLEGLKNLMN